MKRNLDTKDLGWLIEALRDELTSLTTTSDTAVQIDGLRAVAERILFTLSQRE